MAHSGTDPVSVAAHALRVTFDDIKKAAAAIKGAVAESDFDHSRTLSEMFGAEIWLKFENLQFTASFKERGALNRLLALSEDERRRGVIATSAGNHAQGVAYHATRLGVPSTIVMPVTTPTVKVENTKKLGARVILHGRTFEDAYEFCLKHAAENKLVLIHAFNDPLVIAGQGTIGLEIMRAVPDLDAIIVPIGGGGLISGIAVAAKAINPKVRVIGVEATLYPSMTNAVKGSCLPIGGDTLAEGIAVAKPGALSCEIVKALVDDIVLVSEAEIERAVTLLITIEKTVVEGAGAAGLAAVLSNPARFKGQKIGLVLCGGNIDTRLLASVLTRELAREGRLSELLIDIPDHPGQLAKVASVIGGEGANIVEVHHQRVFTQLPAKGTELMVVIETRDAAHLLNVVESLKGAGYEVEVRSGGVRRV